MNTKWMKRIGVLLVAGSLSVGTFAFGDDWHHYRDDHHRNEWREHRDIHHDNHNIHRDYRNLRNDEHRGDWRAAQADRRDLRHDRHERDRDLAGWR